MPESRGRVERTTEDVRRIIQTSDETNSALARRFDINRKTVIKWRSRESVESLRSGPRLRRTASLSPEEEATAVWLRRFTLLPLDDLLFVLRPNIPHVTRSTLHRCLQRHGVSRLPPAPVEAHAGRIGRFVIEQVRLPSREGELQALSAVDLGSRFIFADVYREITPQVLAGWLTSLVAITPYRVCAVLAASSAASGQAESPLWDAQVFRDACAAAGVKRRPIPAGYPWPQPLDQPHMPTGRRFDTLGQARATSWNFQVRFNSSSRLKSLAGMTPLQYAATQGPVDLAAYLGHSQSQSRLQSKAAETPGG